MKKLFLATAACAALALFLTPVTPVVAQGYLPPAKPLPAGETPLFPVQAEIATGRILITLPAPDADGVYGRYIYANTLRTGLGSTDIRMDRGMDGKTQMLAFRRVGKKIAVIFENPRYRADGGTKEEKVGVATSLAFTTAAMLDVVSSKPNGEVVVDLAPFLASDVMDIATKLNSGAAGGFPDGYKTSHGTGFKWVESASAADPATVRAFPDNVEMDSLETFQGDKSGPEIGEIAPDNRRISMMIHHTFVRLPKPGFTTRKFDVRVASESTPVFDYNQPLGKSIVLQLANHFRLEKIDPNAARSKVKKPIVFYIDNAVPEPMRSALLKGVSLWSEAFDKAGLIDGFQAKVLPNDVDPMDVRYNIVHWANRLTRSWSYGQMILDPRTGEIIRGSVVLGGDRVRQDTNIFEGLVGTKNENGGGPDDAVKAALARLTVLGAHEVGHAIGFNHNFAASTQDRTTVMEYPGPRVKIEGGKLDLSDAYAMYAGKWDDFMVDWLYGEPVPGVDPDKAAAAKTDKMEATGIRYITDIDSRADNMPTPLASMWDDGPDPVAELPHIMKVRDIALSNFGPGVLHAGEPLSTLRRKFVPVWLYHRYQTISTSKSIGGVDYAYGIVGSNRPAPKPVDAAKQREALTNLLDTLSAKTLTVPNALVNELSWGVQGYESMNNSIEVLDTAGASAFDALAATDAGAQVTLSPLLEPLRLTRVDEQHARDSAQLGVGELLDKLLAATVGARKDAVGRRVAYRTLMMLEKAARNTTTSPDVAAQINDRLERTAEELSKASGDSEDASWAHSMGHMLRSEPLVTAELAKDRPRDPIVPLGSPIGEDGWMDGR